MFTSDNNTAPKEISDSEIEREELDDAPVIDRPVKSGKLESFPLDASKVSEWTGTQSAIATLEKLLNAKVVSMYVASGSSLTLDEVKELYNHLHLIGEQEQIAFIIRGSGGNAFAAYRLVRLLRRYAKKLIVVAPEEAQSALTMLCLGADEILCGPLTVFSPTDTSISNHPLAPVDSKGNPVTVESSQLKKYLELVEVDRFSEVTDFRMTPHHSLGEKINPIFLGSIQRSLSLSKMLMSDILKTHISNEEVIQSIVDKLNDAYPSHSYPVTSEELEGMGLNVQEMIPEANHTVLNLLRMTQGFSKEFFPESEADRRRRVRRAAVIESLNLRSFYNINREEKLTNGQWVTTKLGSDYLRATVAKTKKGTLEARVLTEVQFRSVLDGKTVEV